MTNNYTNIPIRKLDDCRIFMKSDKCGFFQRLDDHRICVKFSEDSDQNSNHSDDYGILQAEFSQNLLNMDFFRIK